MLINRIALFFLIICIAGLAYPASQQEELSEKIKTFSFHSKIAGSRKERVAKLEELITSISPTNHGMIDLPDTEGNTLLHRAANAAAFRCTKKLLSRGANGNIQNKDGDTPLHCFARKFGETELQKIIPHFRRAGADILMTNNAGKLPIELCFNPLFRFISEQRKSIYNEMKQDLENQINRVPTLEYLAIAAWFADKRDSVKTGSHVLTHPEIQQLPEHLQQKARKQKDSLSAQLKIFFINTAPKKFDNDIVSHPSETRDQYFLAKTEIHATYMARLLQGGADIDRVDFHYDLIEQIDTYSLPLARLVLKFSTHEKLLAFTLSHIKEKESQ
jgi:hypothetical protein